MMTSPDSLVPVPNRRHTLGPAFLAGGHVLSQPVPRWPTLPEQVDDLGGAALGAGAKLSQKLVPFINGHATNVAAQDAKSSQKPESDDVTTGPRPP